MKVLKKIINIAVDILIICVLLMSALILTTSLTSKDTGSPDIFGYTVNTIQSGSMEPVMYQGDMLIGKATNMSNDDKYKKGDIVMFQSSEQGEDGQSYIMIKCHRIVDVKTENGSTTYLTKGDNNELSDELEDGYIPASKIVGVYQSSDYSGKLLKGWGKPYDFLRTKLGFFLAIVLPMIIFFIYEVIRVVLNLTAFSKEKALVAADANTLTEEQKKKAIEEYLAQQEASKKDAEDSSSGEKSEKKEV